jgi:hypothetical protein
MSEKENWGDIADTAWEAPKRTSVEELKPTSSLVDKLKNPVVQKILNAMLATAILTGGGAVAVEAFKKNQAGIEAAQKEIEKTNDENMRADLISRLVSDGVSEEDINSVLEDEELMNLYRELRVDNPNSFDEYLAARGIELNN